MSVVERMRGRLGSVDAAMKARWRCDRTRGVPKDDSIVASCMTIVICASVCGCDELRGTM